jgi:peroxin-14
MIEKNKDSQTQSLAELQQELKSLKALLLSRGTGLSATPVSPLPFPGRPSIPAWQLAGASQTNGNGVSGGDPVSTTAVTLPSPGAVVPPVNGKGKEVEVVSEASGSSS